MAISTPRLPDEPLIFAEVALVEGFPGRIAPLIDPAAAVADPHAADTAVFYSISNAQAGLKGIAFGGYLIRRVAQVLAAEFRYLENFVTLSPIPGFRAWLDRRPAGDGDGELDDRSRALLAQPWHRDPPVAEALKAPLMRLCARYLVEQRDAAGRLRYPVADFHLSNGAGLCRLNWLADPSPNGIGRSAGMMANYVYRLDGLDENIAAYRDGRPAVEEAVSRLLPG